MALTKNAQKLLAWFRLYKITPTEYNEQLPPTAQRRGAFVNAIQELVDYESAYGYFDVS